MSAARWEVHPGAEGGQLLGGGGGGGVGASGGGGGGTNGLSDMQGWGFGEGGVKWEGTDVGGLPLRTALHTISMSLQNSFWKSHNWRLVSWKALRALNARRRLPVYPVFEDEKSKASDERSVKQKIALKKDQQD